MRSWMMALAAVAAACATEPASHEELASLEAHASNEDRERDILELDGQADAGEAVFAENCVECHAESGLGVDDPTHPGIGANLGEALREPKEELVHVILEGEEEMPSFADRLSDQQIADVLAYIHDDLFP